MTLVAIIIGTLVAGIGSVWLAAALSFGLLARYTQHMLSLAAGALMATAFMHLLPEAFESQVSAHDLFLVLLLGLVFFFLLDKAELWHHGHEHHRQRRRPTTRRSLLPRRLRRRERRRPNSDPMRAGAWWTARSTGTACPSTPHAKVQRRHRQRRSPRPPQG